ncbi:uncharacterized protein MKK02DRAFT_43487 [Dioszegia hungarica]|uniref:Polysaccharide lyase 14 domain-containing protein n=1 Tax=Dioszegia hungarica TaxID=4972 RepID=A0AA38LXM8_9TREE|nr:uncharacterized protein MKK02DRAFT_43487 [Dioszegia hungarica]KAI9637561.1 hypothetical protein MKK02DRAFT_43487 [Dioszegia hungarica]
MHSLSILLLSLPFLPGHVLADTLQSVISAYSLTAASYNFSVPTTTLNSDDAAQWIVSKWDATGGKLDFGENDVVFSPDPASTSATVVRRQGGVTVPTSAASSTASIRASSSTSRSTSKSATGSATSPSSTNLSGQPPVLRVEYPQGSYSKKTGGTQFTSNLTTLAGGSAGGYEKMLLSYDVWFPAGYNFNLGGKLPGLRGGPDRFGCSGGNQTDGTGCFSTRLMWRQNGAGEVYAYIPSTTTLCSQGQTICNSDYGVSLGRGQFSFLTGQWQTIWLLVVLNEVGKSNGLIELWYNGVQALQFPQSALRTSSSITGITGLFFSTFFGGDDTTWASPTQQFSYYRNIQLFAGSGASTAAGPSTTTSSTGSKGGAGARMGGAGGWTAAAVLGSVGVLAVVGWGMI